MGTARQERWPEEAIAAFQERLAAMLKRVDKDDVLGCKLHEMIVHDCTMAVLEEMERIDNEFSKETR